MSLGTEDATSREELSEGVGGTPSSASSARRKRGTGFPVVSLAEAATILKEAGKFGFEHPTEAFASYMGHSSTNSGAFRQRLSAFRDLGLITGRGEMLTMTDTARLIALPTSESDELGARQRAFLECEVFAQLYERSAKGTPLDPDRLGGRAVHEFGVSPSSAKKFVESFSESLVAASLAEIDESGAVVLWDPEGPTQRDQAPGSEASAVGADPPISGRMAPPPSSLPTAVRQIWERGDAQIILEVRTKAALAPRTFSKIGEVVSLLEELALEFEGPLDTEHEGES